MKTRKNIGDSVCVLAIDAGGTSFKSALIGGDGKFVQESFYSIAVDSQGSQEAILSVYNEIVSRAFRYAKRLHCGIAGMGIATPGPFDIGRGQSLMTHKFQSLYKLDLARAIRDVAGLPASFAIRFVHDAHAFIMGENWRGNGRGFDKVIGLTLGTGLGFACSIDQHILTDELGGPRISLFKMKYGNGVLEDRISKRGIVNAYIKLRNIKSPIGLEVEEIAGRARTEQDRAAISVFHETGTILLDYMEPICNAMKIECILLGGQISKSFDLIQPGLKEISTRVPSIKRVDQAAHIDSSALLGAGSIIFAKNAPVPQES